MLNDLGAEYAQNLEGNEARAGAGGESKENRAQK